MWGTKKNCKLLVNGWHWRPIDQHTPHLLSLMGVHLQGSSSKDLGWSMRSLTVTIQKITCLVKSPNAITFCKSPLGFVRLGKGNITCLWCTFHFRYMNTLDNACCHWKTYPRQRMKVTTDVTPVNVHTPWLMRASLGLCCLSLADVT